MRIYSVPSHIWLDSMSGGTVQGTQPWEKLCGHARELGFDTLLLRTETNAGPIREDAIPTAVQIGAEQGLELYLDVAVDMRDSHLPTWIQFFIDRAGEGVAGFCCRGLAALTAQDWGEVIRAVHRQHPDCAFLAWTPGLAPGQVAALAGRGFVASFLSLPWWDYRSYWLIEERDRLLQLGDVIAPLRDLEEPDSQTAERAAAGDALLRRALWTAALTGDGLLLTGGDEERIGFQEVAQANRKLVQRKRKAASLQLLSGPRSPVTAVFRRGVTAELLVLNPATLEAVPVDRRLLSERMPGSYALNIDSSNEIPDLLAPAGCAFMAVEPGSPVKGPVETLGSRLKILPPPLDAPRIAVENIAPSVDGGRYPAKRTVGERVTVRADVFVDGHEHIAVHLLWRPADESAWRRLPMRPLGNDRWEAAFATERIGPHCYTVQAWRDAWLSYTDSLRKKVEGGLDVSLEAEEGRILMAEALTRIQDDMPDTASTLAALLRATGRPQARTPALKIPPVAVEQLQVLLSAEAAQAMADADNRPFETTAAIHPLTVDRREARYASWYELFPRSESRIAGRHGRFSDVIERLPAIRDMGFDVLYMPPIHPIGHRNRKGRNNALQAAPEDPGSPYAIGSAEGGHDAVHPELGALDDFQALVQAARDHGMEIAMDFAIQCSPDHPWLAQHPEWFDWRADGSLRYAENPPKRYEDIVNPDFYTGAGATRQAALWRALRDIVLFWVGQGVQIFRVDNPHTKPLPFWQWLIAQVQAAHPDVIFLSEAFTRPKMMYRLAKIGFTQSYTYFTWRNDKAELQAYLQELNTPPVADFFRPNFFVNTPDINPYFLQGSGRPGFLIRAALAATMSGLWGMYSGFELCEAESLPGKEEYLDSEKYQLRAWDWDRPGNIKAEIRRLNRIRRTNPALQTHLGIRFHHVDNDRIIFFSKSTEEGDNIVLVAISVDPHQRQTGTLELPVQLWDAQDGRPTAMRDLFEDGDFVLQGSRQYIELSPEKPFLLWSVQSTH